jgi:hypothetical protein
MEQVLVKKEVFRGAKILNPEVVNKNRPQGIIDNQEFIMLMNISKRTALRWRMLGKVAYIVIGKKVYYKLEDVERMINESYVRRA